MTRTVLVKRSVEDRTFDIDCTGELATGETIASVGTVAAAPTGPTFGPALINAVAIEYRDGYEAAVGKVMQFRIAAGTSGTRYKVTAAYITSKGDTRQAAVMLDVED